MLPRTHMSLIHILSRLVCVSVSEWVSERTNEHIQLIRMLYVAIVYVRTACVSESAHTTSIRDVLHTHSPALKYCRYCYWYCWTFVVIIVIMCFHCLFYYDWSCQQCWYLSPHQYLLRLKSDELHKLIQHFFFEIAPNFSNMHYLLVSLKILIKRVSSKDSDRFFFCLIEKIIFMHFLN